MKTIILPSLLAADFLHLGDEVDRINRSGADMIHCDVMDGVYVPNISFGFDIIKLVGTKTCLPLDVHMMTCCPEKYIDVLKSAGVSSVTVHSDYADRQTVINTLRTIRAAGMKPAVSLKPKSTAESVVDFIPYVDLILIMTVEPGFGGQKFMPDMLPKISEVRRYLDAMNPSCDLQLDGGISENNIAECSRAGANSFVAGTTLLRADDMRERVAALRRIADYV